EGLARRGAEVTRRLLVPAIEAIEDGKHDEQSKRQRPCQMRAQPGRKGPGAGGEPIDEGGEADGAGGPPEARGRQPELDGDTERNDDRGHDETRHRRVENERRAAKAAPEGIASEQGNHHGEHHDDRAEFQRAAKGGPYVDDTEATPEPTEPMR